MVAKDYHNFKTPCTNTTGVKGVHPFVSRGKFKGYRANLVVNKIAYSSKVKATIEEAALARKELEKQYLDK